MGNVQGGDHPEGEPDRLVRIAAAGDDRARLCLLEAHRDRLRRMVAVRLDRRIAARVDPSDVVQETLAEAAASLSDYLRCPPLPFYPWLRQIASDRIVDLHRRHIGAGRRSVTREVAAGPGLPEASAQGLADRLAHATSSPSRRAARDEERAMVRAAIDRLGPTDREILVLRHLEGLETDEIAALLGIRPDAVRARHVRALARLRSLFDRDPRE